MSEIACDGEQTCGKESDREVVEEGADIAEAVSGPPFLDVVVTPDQGVDDSLNVLEHDVDYEYKGGQLAVTIKELQWHETDNVGHDAQQDAEDEVGGQGGGGVRRDARGSNDEGIATWENMCCLVHGEGKEVVGHPVAERGHRTKRDEQEEKTNKTMMRLVMFVKDPALCKLKNRLLEEIAM